MVSLRPGWQRPDTVAGAPHETWVRGEPNVKGASLRRKPLGRSVVSMSRELDGRRRGAGPQSLGGSDANFEKSLDDHWRRGGEGEKLSTGRHFKAANETHS